MSITHKHTYLCAYDGKHVSHPYRGCQLGDSVHLKAQQPTAIPPPPCIPGCSRTFQHKHLHELFCAGILESICGRGHGVGGGGVWVLVCVLVCLCVVGGGRRGHGVGGSGVRVCLCDCMFVWYVWWYVLVCLVVCGCGCLDVSAGVGVWVFECVGVGVGGCWWGICRRSHLILYVRSMTTYPLPSNTIHSR